ncbi:competence protein CoiA [Sunxiuqinia elliptica]|uniref:Competence protein CoiA-like family protein n=1 Tax=Sunxiuqinia elliptica TaxID=655355 RepID=A0A1I2BE21_9BACT|nr:competence protein CoiA family protein [Sunxiuqinia elliptica]SFE54217.1 Competence protein CoiA-like family protein [Sunxiuqinia elliptica]
MPLRAFIDNEEIISIEQTDEQWDDIKRRIKTQETSLILPCCKQEGFLRKSRKGLKHFVHSKSNKTCDWKPESPEHLKAKIEIIKACKINGWKAIPEYSETNWRADVLAIQNEKRIAFEVQWSKQTFEETKFRQDRYRESNVRGCWFFRTAPKELRKYSHTLIANNEIPAFKIFKDEDSNITAQLSQTQLPLKSLVDNLLKRKIKFCEHIKLKHKQDVNIVFFKTSCWRCHKPQHLWTVEPDLRTACDRDFYVIGSLWDDDDIDKNSKIYEAVKQFLQTENGKHLKIGKLKYRYSKTVKNSYLSHGCFYCDAIFGDFFLNSEKLEGQNSSNSIVHKVEIEFGTMRKEGKHWCYSENGEFCE